MTGFFNELKRGKVIRMGALSGVRESTDTALRLHDPSSEICLGMTPRNWMIRPCSSLQWINHVDERKTMKVRIAGHNASDAVFAHQDGGMGIVQDVALQIGQLHECRAQYLGVTVGRQQHRCRRCGEHGIDELPGDRCCPGFAEHSGMSADTQKFVDDVPSQIPRRCLHPPLLKSRAARLVKVRIAVGGIDQNIRINDEHSALVHRLEQSIAIRHVHRVATAAQGWQRRQLGRRIGLLGLEQQTQAGFNQFGHRASASRRFLTQARHHGVIDIERGFHMGNHIVDMAVCQSFDGGETQ